MFAASIVAFRKGIRSFSMRFEAMEWLQENLRATRCCGQSNVHVIFECMIFYTHLHDVYKYEYNYTYRYMLIESNKKSTANGEASRRGDRKLILWRIDSARSCVSSGPIELSRGEVGGLLKTMSGIL